MLKRIWLRLVFLFKLFIIRAYQFVRRRKKYVGGAALIFVFYAFYSSVVDELLVKKVSPFLVVKSDRINDIFFGIIFLMSIILFLGKYLLAGGIKDVWNDFYPPAVVLFVYLLPRSGLVKNSHAELTYYQELRVGA